MNIIDFHVHAGDFYRLRDDIQDLLTRRPLEPDVNVADVFSLPIAMEDYLRRNGVVRAIVLAECGPGTNFTIDSELIAKHCADNDFFVPFGNINPNFHNVMDEFWKSVRLGVKGFKFYPADHSFDPLVPDMLTVYRLCAEMGLPVLFHTGLTAQRDTEQKFINPIEFRPIAEANPDLVLILAHGGKPLWYSEATTMALTYPNVYIDTALLDPLTMREDFPALEELRKKILFGSDWPVVGSYAAMMDKYKQAGIPDDILGDIFYNNAERVLTAAMAKQATATPRAFAIT